MGAAKREWERWEDLKADVTAIAVGTGALKIDESTDEIIRVEDTDAERHTYARATIYQKRGRLEGSLQEVREAIKDVLNEAE